MIRLIKYGKGYVKIKVWGYSPERFMNLCSNHNILLWDVEQYKEYYIMNISIKGFFALRPILRKTKTKVVLLKKYGLPFLIPKMKKRFIFVAGIIGCLLFLMLMSNHLWAIEVVGNHTITLDKFMDFLEENEIVYGMKKKGIRIEELEKEIRLQFDIVTWTSVRLDGTKLYIQIKENTLLRKDHKPKFEVGDLIAKKEGTIVKMVTRNGIPQVKVGTEIKPGDLLVAGNIPIMGEDGLAKAYQYCNADADIYLQCTYPYADKVKWNYLKKEYTGENQKIRFLKVFGKQIQLPHPKVKYENYDVFTNQKQIKILDNLYLPVFVGNEVVREYQEVSMTYSKEAAKKILNQNFQKFLSDLKEKGVQIIQKDVKIEAGKNAMTVSGTILAVELTGTKTKAEKLQPTEGKADGEDVNG